MGIGSETATEPAAAVGEDGWPFGETRAALLAVLGEASSDQKAVCQPDGADSGPFCQRWRLRTTETRLAIVFGGGQVYVVGRAGVHYGNSG